jgi:hypothetical protein
MLVVRDVPASSRFCQQVLAAVNRARRTGVPVVRDVHVNPNALQQEI